MKFNPNAVLENSQQWLDEMGNLTLNNLRPHLGVHQNALLRHEEWLQIDAEVQDVVRTGLVGIQDLVTNGLTKPLGGLGTYISMYEQVSDMTEADVSMEGIVPGKDDRVTFTPQYVPVPIIHKDFSISQRMLLASRRQGEALDVTQARTATRIVRDKMESMLFNGLTKQFGGYSIYGYTTAPHRITGTAVGDFGTAGNGYKTMVKALGALGAVGFQGPFMVYIAQTQYNELLNLISTSYERNELEVIKAGLPQIMDVKPAYALAAGSLVFVQMTKEVVDLAVAEDVTPVQWDEMGGMMTRFRIMTALAPRIKFDVNNVCGVLHYTGA